MNSVSVDLQKLGLPRSVAVDIEAHIHVLDAANTNCREVWTQVSKLYLTADVPFEAHLLVFNHVFREWDWNKLGPIPIWYPTELSMAATNVSKFMRRNRSLLADISLQELGIRFHRPAHSVLEEGRDGNPDSWRWFSGAQLNIADCALQANDLDAPAIVYGLSDNPARPHSWTHRKLQSEARHIAVALRAHRQAEGCRIAIIGDMTPRAVACYLAVVLVGGAVVSVAPSFSAEEIASRLALAQATLVITQETQDYAGKSLRLYSKIRSTRGHVPQCVVIPSEASGGSSSHLLSGDMSWDEFLRPAVNQPAQVLAFQPARVAADTIMNILFSSGTTGEPKAIPWTHTTPLRPAVNAWSCQDVRSGDVIAWPTSLGWMMGPWLIFASLLNRAAIGLFLGAPTTPAFCQFVCSARVTMLGVIPSIVRAWRVSSATDGLDWSSIRCFSSSGEASNPEDMHWLMSRAGYKPVMEYCGGTEVGGAFVGSTMLHPCVPSCFATPSLGFELFILPSDGAKPVSLEAPDAANIGLRGEIAVRAPAMGTSQQLLNRNHHDVYFKGMPTIDGLPLRRHGDEFEVLPGLGYIKAHGRCDDTMNLGGIKVGSVEIEEVIVLHVSEVQQAAAVAIRPPMGGPEQLVLYLVLHGSGVTDPVLLNTVTLRCKQAVRAHLNPLFKIHQVVIVSSLPRNASNKVMRRVLREETKKLASCALTSKL